MCGAITAVELVKRKISWNSEKRPGNNEDNYKVLHGRFCQETWLSQDDISRFHCRELLNCLHGSRDPGHVYALIAFDVSEGF